MDAAFCFQLRWQQQQPQNRKTVAQQAKLTWNPRAARTIWENIFGTDVYGQVERLMRAVLASAALVMIADGRVNLDERKNALDALIDLPIGRYFAQFELRKSLEGILRDMKSNREASRKLALQVLAPYRKHPDARIIVAAMRRIAVVDGHVSIQEERMVEKLSQYLRGQGDVV